MDPNIGVMTHGYFLFAYLTNLRAMYLIRAIRLPFYHINYLGSEPNYKKTINLFKNPYSNHSENVFIVLCYCGNKHLKLCGM